MRGRRSTGRRHSQGRSSHELAPPHMAKGRHPSPTVHRSSEQEPVMMTRREMIQLVGAAVPAARLRWPASAAQARAIARGPFAATWESLKQYRAPDWFRDAKFGIWAHWTAQCVPEQGDWYARRMYMEGDPDYQYQVQHYGHPSRVGFKEIDHLWHAERWEPERLIHL